MLVTRVMTKTYPVEAVEDQEAFDVKIAEELNAGWKVIGMVPETTVRWTERVSVVQTVRVTFSREEEEDG